MPPGQINAQQWRRNTVTEEEMAHRLMGGVEAKDLELLGGDRATISDTGAPGPSSQRITAPSHQRAPRQPSAQSQEGRGWALRQVHPGRGRALRPVLICRPANLHAPPSSFHARRLSTCCSSPTAVLLCPVAAVLIRQETHYRECRVLDIICVLIDWHHN
jgi:hypothetical protein